MINIKGYQEAIEGLRELLPELINRPDDQECCLVVLHRFEVLSNISESILRRFFASISTDERSAFLSLRELIRQAADEGLVLSSPQQWLSYVSALEAIRERWMETASVNLDADTRLLLSHFVNDVQAFADRVERLVSVVAD